MKNLIIGLLLIITIHFFSCQSTNNKNNNNTENSSEKKINNVSTKNDSNDSCAFYLSSSKKLDSILLSSINFDKQLAIHTNNTFAKCALLCNNDSISPLYLMKAAQLSQSLNQIHLSEKYLQIIIKDYPKSKFIPSAKFLLAEFYADVNLLNQPEKAKQLLNEIIKEYPRTIWAENAAAALQWVGKSDEEILQKLKQKK
jgi:TolA-binding protein